jgi:NADPH:quinone reductase
MALSYPPGSYAEYTVVQEDYLALKPKNLSMVEAAATPLALITAWEALVIRGDLKEGQSMLIHAGAGGVGHIAIQLAHYFDALVATTISGTEKAEFV